MTAAKSPKRRSWIRSLLYLILILLAAGAITFVLGPREPVDLTLRFSATAVDEDLDRYLENSEASVPDLRDSAEKEIVWAFPESRAKTPIALVYLHGFSAAKAEIRPVPDMAAEALQANIFYTRLTGHGRDGPAMASASVNDWLNDTAEAIEIGNRIGDKVVLVSTSTGGTLAALAAAHPELKDRIDGIVFVSPNFAIRSRLAGLLTLPFARDFIPVIGGRQRSFEPVNDRHAKNWTTRYPTVAVLPMAALVRHVRTVALGDVDVPALFIFHPEDQVVDPVATETTMERWGGPVSVLRAEASGDAYNHVIAGDIMSPSNNAAFATAITEFVNSI